METMTTNVLILCTHNSARSVLSEGMLNHWAAKLGKNVRALQAIGHRMLQPLELPLDTMTDADLQAALTAIVES